MDATPLPRGSLRICVRRQERMRYPVGSERRTVTTPDARKLEVLAAGNPAGYPWLWIPGSPSAAADYPRLDDLAMKLDLRLVTWSRPGYGDSSPRPMTTEGPRIADDVPDI